MQRNTCVSSSNSVIIIPSNVFTKQYAQYVGSYVCVTIHTVPLESIQTPLLFTYFLTLQHYSKMYWIKKKSSAIYTQYPVMTKRKKVFRHFCTFIKNWKQIYLNYIIIQTLYYETQNWDQVHPVSLIILDVSTTWLEFTCGKFKVHTCLYKVPQLTVHVWAKTKPWGWRNCP